VLDAVRTYLGLTAGVDDWDTDDELPWDADVDLADDPNSYDPDAHDPNAYDRDDFGSGDRFGGSSARRGRPAGDPGYSPDPYDNYPPDPNAESPRRARRSRRPAPVSAGDVLASATTESFGDDATTDPFVDEVTEPLGEPPAPRRARNRSTARATSDTAKPTRATPPATTPPAPAP
ncbi:cell division protein FtsK, partial [Gordonia sp. i37]